MARLSPVAVAADEVDAGAPWRRPGRGEIERRAVEHDRAGTVIGASPKSARPICSCPAPRRPTRPTTSPACKVERRPARPLRRSCPSSCERASPCRCAGAAEHLRGLAADDRDRHLRGVVSPTGARPTSRPSRSTTTVGDLEHLVEPVRDVDHADAAVAQAAQRRRTGARPRRRKAGGRLVEHEDLRLGGKRAGDRDQRFLGAGQALDADVGVDVGAEQVQRRRGAPARRRQSTMPARRG